MATEIVSLFAKIGADTSELSKGLEDSGEKVNKFGSVLGGIGKAAVGGFAAMGAAAVGATVGIAGLAAGVIGAATSITKGNAEFERYETQFGVLLGSVDAAKQRLADLADFGAKTPFELPEVVRADKVLVAFGLDSATTAKTFGVSAEQIRTTIGDVASGTGARFEELAGTFGKFAAGATGEAIARFQEMGIATKEEMASWGLQFDKAGSLITPAKEAFSVLESHVRAKFGGMMNAQSATFEGMASNLSDWVGTTKRKLAAPIFDVLKDKLGNVLTLLGSPAVTGALDKMASGLAEGIGKAMDFIGPFIDQVFKLITVMSSGGGVDGLIKGLGAAFPALKPLLAILGPIITQVQTFITSLSSGAGGNPFGALLSGAQEIGAVLGPILAQVLPIIGQLAAAFVPLIPVIGQVVGIAIQLGGQIASAVMPIIQQLVPIITEIGTKATQLVAAVMPAVTSIVGIITANLPKVQAIIQQVIADVWPVIQNILNEAVALVRENMPQIQSIIQTVGEIIGIVLDKIKVVWGEVWPYLKQVIDVVWTNIKTVVQTAIDTVKDIVDAVMLMIKGDWEGAWNKIKEVVGNLLEGALTIVRDTLNKMGDAIGGKVGDFLKMGGDLIQGLIDGVKGAAGAVLDAARGVIQGAIDGAKALLGIHSPSKVFAGIGEQTGTGFVEGIVGTAGKINDAMSTVIGGAVKMANKTMAENLTGGGLTDAVQKIIADKSAGGGTGTGYTGGVARTPSATDLPKGSKELWAIIAPDLTSMDLGKDVLPTKGKTPAETVTPTKSTGTGGVTGKIEFVITVKKDGSMTGKVESATGTAQDMFVFSALQGAY